MALAWPWHFVTLSEAEKEQRRELLDLRGSYAQYSMLLAILLVRLYTWVFQSGNEPPKPNRRKPLAKSWLDSPPFAGWIETRRQYLVCSIWLMWLLCLCIWNSGDDYLHLTKSLGHVALSQFPFQILMSPPLYLTSTPASPSLISVLTTIPQPTINAYHRLFGRLVIAPLLVSHALLYDSFFLQTPHPEFGILFAKRIRDADVQWGILGVVAFTSVVLFARPAVKPRWAMSLRSGSGSARARQQVFWAVHVGLVVVLGVAAYSHVQWARLYMIEGLVGSMANVGCGLFL
ncbi:putative metalloreductase Fre8 [Aspergillus homomorphus CBS 101889]|uniref:Ferric oxidoreductase domain-containing protein n=1 Tax=Aspergillus homomorphus (strain CBS 101889) TaxID=1450537 RepID=A0A395HRM9_ASPHC|nr:hypothetical protein BO97DRAFT_395321 [Aspergillus homomorphus CBS 101889]RAL09995.1 hypothetical protein BO97DRAFT_395321 [Aspergillus homomorphus CBS 101889]